MEQQPQLNDHNKQEYPPHAYSRAFIKRYHGKTFRLPALPQRPHRKKKVNATIFFHLARQRSKYKLSKTR